jgi:iron transport multicopper oxidase
MNDGQSAVYEFQAGKTYKFRILNIGAYSSFFVNFQGHEMQVIGLDGTVTQSTSANTLYVGAAQRYEVLVTAKKNATSNFGILAMLDTSLFEGSFAGNPTVLGQMQYNKAWGAPPAYTGLPNSIMPPTDDITMKPYDKEPLLGPVSKQYVLNFDLTLINGVPRAIINNVTFLTPKVPTLYTALSAPDQYKMNPTIYGVNTNALPIEYGDVVEIVLYNNIPFGHPWHLHGHQFQVVARSEPNAFTNGQRYDPSQADPIPMRRDVAGVQAGGYVAYRFKADNPGIQL